MAIPHFNVAVITKSQGQSAVASASYRSGQALYNELENKLHDYSRKQDVRYTEIMAPDGAPEWATNRQTLWNQVEAAEKRKDARFARSLTIALPRELNLEQNTVMVAKFARENFVSHGMIADLAIHDASASDGGKNPHAHIMLTLRDIDASGFGKKNRTWDDVKRLESWRDAWEHCVNHSMEQVGVDDRISMKSYEEQGIDKIPTKHMGPNAWQLEQQSVETHVGDENRKISHQNALREILKSHWGEPQQAPEPAPSEPVPAQPVTEMPASTEFISTEPVPARQTLDQQAQVRSQQSALTWLEAETSDPEGAAHLQREQDKARHKAALWEILQERWGDTPAPDQAQVNEQSDPLLEHRRSQHIAQARLAGEAKGHKSEDGSLQVDSDQAEHKAMLHERLLTHEVMTRQQKIRINIVRQYADLLAERAAKIFKAAARQFKSLCREAVELGETGQGYER